MKQIDKKKKLIYDEDGNLHCSYCDEIPYLNPMTYYCAECRKDFARVTLTEVREGKTVKPKAIVEG